VTINENPSMKIHDCSLMKLLMSDNNENYISSILMKIHHRRELMKTTNEEHK